MLLRISERIKTVSAENASDFDNELDKVLEDFQKQGISYKLELAPQLGFTAFIRYEKKYQIAETLADEFQLGGETHKCIECPYFIRPTDGRVKYTRCEITPGIHSKNHDCCNAFYEKLFNGEIKLVEVMSFEEKDRKEV